MSCVKAVLRAPVLSLEDYIIFANHIMKSLVVSTLFLVSLYLAYQHRFKTTFYRDVLALIHSRLLNDATLLHDLRYITHYQCTANR